MFDLKLTALLRLPTTIPYGLRIRPVQLPIDCGEDLTDVTVTAIGTRMQSSGCDLKLQHLHLQALLTDKCVKQAQTDNRPDALICAVANEEGASVAAGDLGRRK